MDIILLIFLCFRIARLAKQKKLSKARWVLLTVVYWLIGESVGIFLLFTLLVSMGRLEPENIQLFQTLPKEFLYVIIAGYLGGYLGYLFTRKRLEDTPDGVD